MAPALGDIGPFELLPLLPLLLPLMNDVWVAPLNGASPASGCCEKEDPIPFAFAAAAAAFASNCLNEVVKSFDSAAAAAAAGHRF